MDGSREAAIEEARTWLGTPFHHHARVKGAGVDCLMLIAAVYANAGTFEAMRIDPEAINIPEYPQDIMMHRNEETYLDGLMMYSVETDEMLPGNIAIWRFGRIYSHAAIIVDWPLVIHAFQPDGIVTYGDATKGALSGRDVKFFDPWGLK